MGTHLGTVIKREKNLVIILTLRTAITTSFLKWDPAFSINEFRKEVSS